MYRSINLLIALLLLALPSYCIDRSYNVTPQWYSGTSDFRTAKVGKNNVLTDSYSRFNSDTFNIVDVKATGEYRMNVTFDITNMHEKNYLTYPTYDYNAKGHKIKCGSTSNPIYGWVIGMRDRDHYNAVWMRTSPYDDILYEDNEVQYCVVTIDGCDTTYHVKWTTCRQENYAGANATFPMWLEYNNGTLIIGAGWIVTTPWEVIHNVHSFGNYTGLYLGAGSSVKLENVWITVKDKETPTPTQWTANSLYNYFTQHGYSSIEGFWEVTHENMPRNSIKMGGDYKLAIVRNNNVYDIIYLSGATKYPGKWHEGCIKGQLWPNASGYFEGVWYDAEGERLDNILAFTYGNDIQLNLTDEDTRLYLSRPMTITITEPVVSERYGTGFMIDTQGYIATNHHVIDNAKEITIVNKCGDFDVEFNAVVIASDSVNDVAILRIEDDNYVPYSSIPYGLSSHKARQGETVFYMGYPIPSILNTDIKTSMGLITAENGIYPSQYMVSIDIDSGSSGSPILDEDGNVIGIICSKIHRKYTDINANYAVKSQYLIRLIDKSNGKLDAPITYNNTSQIKELSHPDRLEAIAPYIFLIITRY